MPPGLLRGLGNRAVARLLARTPKQYKGLYENPKYASTIYPYREGLLKRFVSVYRYMELKEGTPEQVTAAWETMQATLQAELDALDALPTPDAKDKAKKAELTGLLKKTKRTTEEMAWKLGELEARRLSGADVMKQVERHFGTGRVPDWLKPIVTQYTGIRYLSAHGSYHSPRRLLYVMAYQEAEDAAKAAKAKGPVVVEKATIDALKGLSDEAVLERLRALRTDGRIPDAAWASIVDATDLKLDAEGPSVATGDGTGKLEGAWKTEITRWKDGSFADPFKRESGSRSWLAELKRKGTMLSLGVVCNQLAEASAAQRGAAFTDSGITSNAGDMQAAAEKAAAGPAPAAGADGRVAVQPYFCHPASEADLRPGASLFFVDGTWADEHPGGWSIVKYQAGVEYPVAPTPEYVAEWKAWKALSDQAKKDKAAWEKQVKALTAAAKKKGVDAVLPDAPAEAPPETEFKGVKVLPADGATVEGWTYHAVPGQAITRTKEGRTQWMRWSHQATIVKRVDKRVFTFETTKDATWGDGAGMNDRWVSTLMGNPSVFVGWVPGSDPQTEAAPAAATPSAAAAPPAASPPPAAAAPSAPAPADGGVCRPDAAPASGPVCLPEPDVETEAERAARTLAPR